MMDIEHIKKQLAALESGKSDDESAHACEDELHIDFIKHVAENGSEDLAGMAKLILTSEDIDFSRWCA